MKASAARLAGCLGVAVVVGACASSVPPPSDQWTAAQADVGRAQGGHAMQVPEAKLHLQLAIEDLQQSRAMMGTDNHRATTLVTLARAEAQLAESLAKAADARDDAQKAQVELETSGGVSGNASGATNAMPPAPPPSTTNPGSATPPSRNTK